MEELSGGDCYAAFVIPSNFTADLLSIVGGDVKRPAIDYYVNEKLSPVATKITDTGASTLDETINSQFVATVADVVVEALDSSVASDQNKLTQAKSSRRLSRARSGARRLRSATMALRANDQIDWVFTDADDAKDGAAAGRYCAAVVLPESFSRDMLTFYTADATRADIVYYTNEKSSAIAPKITDKGADTVSYKINQVFAQTLSEISLGIADALADYLDSPDVAAGDTSAIKSLLQADAQELSSAISEPVTINRIALYPSENFGSAMAPLYTVLALFIGSLLLMVAIKPQIAPAERACLKNPKHWQEFLGRFGTIACLSLAQTTIMGLGNILLLQVQATQPLLLMVSFWATGLIFAFIVYTLVASFANLGKAIAVLLLIVQVTGCAGSYPLQILPHFVQTISPFLPATHAVGAMRAAMFGVYNNDFWLQLGSLALFAVPFLIIGLVLSRPLTRFMEWYIKRVESSKMIS